MHPWPFGRAGLPGSQTHSSFSWDQHNSTTTFTGFTRNNFTPFKMYSSKLLFTVVGRASSKGADASLMPVVGWGAAATHGNSRGCAKGSTNQGGSLSTLLKMEVFCKKHLIWWVREKVLYEKEGKNRLKAPAEVIYSSDLFVWSADSRCFPWYEWTWCFQTLTLYFVFNYRCNG